MLLQKAYSTAVSSSSNAWRTQVEQKQLVSQISSILLQRYNWVPLLQSHNLSSKLSPPLFLQILHRIQTHPQISLSFFNWVKTNLNFKPDVNSHCQVLLLALGAGLEQPARNMLDSLVQTESASVIGEAMIQSCRGKDSGSTALSFVLECYTRKGLFLEGLEVFRILRVYGFIPSVHACNALLDVLQRKHEIRLAWSVYGVMVRNGVSLDNKLTWSLVAEILSKAEKFERIVKLLDVGVCSSVMYNVVIDFYSQSGDFEAAFRRLNDMRDRKLNPGFSTYSSILDGACKCGNNELIERMINIMIEKGLLPEPVPSQCDSIVQRLSDLGKIDAATLFFTRSRDKGSGLQDGTYGSLLRALSKKGRVEEAIALYQVILGRGVTMKDNTYNAFADVLCKEMQYNEGFKMLIDIMRRGFSPSASSLSNLISALCSKHRWREVDELLDEVLQRGLLPDSFCCYSLVVHYCSSNQIDKAVGLHAKMQKLKAEFDVATYNILLDGLMKEGRVEEALLVFEYMRELKSVNGESFITVICGLCSMKEMREAMKLHDEMLTMGLKPDKEKYKSLILGFKAALNDRFRLGNSRMTELWNFGPGIYGSGDIGRKATDLGFARLQVLG
ncbi:hypothetical protein Tsubulata_021335 [Turnera subulata]|uniref:Pentacotripeptide-repeat region of PRORP domain-containing protein n=1 Tax=Turnera subulata TaxID=218843 RepID=A0A9Q0FZH2_9ROSI|nr:hypothetical protein Tsubulata_021335 [Turnera subulata]